MSTRSDPRKCAGVEIERLFRDNDDCRRIFAQIGTLWQVSLHALPPLIIDRLEPNVQVCIVGGRRPLNIDGSKSEREAALETLRTAWARKTDNPPLIFANHPFTDRGWRLPAISASALMVSVNATKGKSLGEDIWLSVRRNCDKVGIGFNHVLVYFTARAYWRSQTRRVVTTSVAPPGQTASPAVATSQIR